MKLSTKILVTACCATIVIAACNKKETTTTPTTPAVTKTSKDYVMDGKWQITSIKVVIPLTGTQDIYDTMASCRKDNWAMFMSSGRVWSDEGATKCSSSAPQVDSTGTWSMSSDNKTLTANVAWVPSSNKSFTVLEATTTTLKLAQSFDTTISGFPFTIKDTVVAKNIK